MESLTIKGENNNFIEIIYSEIFGFPLETSHFGGYDVSAKIKIESEGFSVNSTFYTSTGEIFSFFQKIKDCNKLLFGTAKFISYEDNLELNLIYDNLGHVEINGKYRNNSGLENVLNFEFNSDQSFISQFINDFQSTINKYGDNKGIK